ncbi:DUF167 domain-containing protein [Stetteria hydrogenophila]
MPVPAETLRKLLEDYGDRVRFPVYVRPESNRTALVLEGDELVFLTEEPPVEGRANASLVRFLARALGVNRSQVEIVHGARSRAKVVEIRGLDADAVSERLAEVVEPW